MTLIKWDSLKNVSALQNRINRLFVDAFPGARMMDDEIGMGPWCPAVDIYDCENSIVIEAELPGIRKENVSVDVKGCILTLKGEKAPGKEIKEEQYCRKERSYGTFQRSFTLPSEFDPDRITAKFKDGLLEIEIPKPEAGRPKEVKVILE